MVSSLVSRVARTILLMFWIAWISALASLIPAPYGTVLSWAGGLVLVVHLVEYLALKPRFATRGRDDLSLARTLLFGFVHWLPMLRRTDAENAS